MVAKNNEKRFLAFMFGNSIAPIGEMKKIEDIDKFTGNFTDVEELKLKLENYNIINQRNLNGIPVLYDPLNKHYDKNIVYKNILHIVTAEFLKENIDLILANPEITNHIYNKFKNMKDKTTLEFKFFISCMNSKNHRSAIIDCKEAFYLLIDKMKYIELRYLCLFINSELEKLENGQILVKKVA